MSLSEFSGSTLMQLPPPTLVPGLAQPGELQQLGGGVAVTWERPVGAAIGAALGGLGWEDCG